MLGEGIACQLDEFRIDFVGKWREETIAGIRDCILPKITLSKQPD
jgi:hypothetical protein